MDRSLFAEAAEFVISLAIQRLVCAMEDHGSSNVHLLTFFRLLDGQSRFYLNPNNRVAAPPARQVYQILHLAFFLAPVVAGIDKFLHLLVNWDMYLTPWVANLSPISGHRLMLLVGVVEIVAGLIVAFRPRAGALVVFAWLWAINRQSPLGSGFL